MDKLSTLQLRSLFLAALAGAPLSILGACGATTTDSGTKAAPDGGGQCEPGRTRKCVGSGACDGGQTCGNDATWSACDCGSGAGGGSGSGGGGGNGAGGEGTSSGGNGVNAGGAAVNAGGAGVAGGIGETGGGASSGGAASGGAGTGGLGASDPCPTEPLSFDCSGHCQAVSEVCAEVDECGENSVSTILVDLSDRIAVFRTPDRPGDRCDCPASTYVMRVPIGPFLAPDDRYRVTVAAPWEIRTVEPPLSPEGACRQDTEASGVSCLVTGEFRRLQTHVFTRDPNAPARNVVVEQLLGQPTCP